MTPALLNDLSVQIERRTEPYSGLPLVAVSGTFSGECPAPAMHVEVRYDGVPRSRAEVRRVTAGQPNAANPAADAAGPAQFAFGTHLPLEVNIGTISVVLVSDAGETPLGEVSRSLLEAQGATSTAAAPGRQAPDPAASTSLVGRALRNLTSGQIFSPRRWAARLDRWGERAIATSLKVRGKLLARSHRDRSPHDAYLAHAPAPLALDPAHFRYRPKISLIVPVYDVPVKWFRRTVESVRAQWYDNWELCIADDASTDLPLRHYLARLLDDPQIRLTRRNTNGHICAASNSAAATATGEFIALLDHDDLLAPDALLEVVALLQQHPDADVIYSDEDKIDAHDRRYDPQFKPDWSPELLLSYNYINHFTCIRRSVFERAGRFREGYEGSQDHDLLLRISSLTQRFYHIPRILYHWRAIPESTAASATVKPFVHTSGQKAITDHLRRLGSAAIWYVPEIATRLNLPITALDGPDAGPSVAIVIAADPTAERLRRTIESIHARTTYSNYRIVVVGDPLAPPHTRELVGKLARRGVSVVWVEGASDPARFSTWANRVAQDTVCDFAVFVRAGLIVNQPRWLSRMLAYAQLPGVGVVGPRVIGPDGKLVEAGIVLNLRDGTTPLPAFAGQPAEAVSYYFYAETARNVAAVSNRCLLVRRQVLLDAGGFEERDFPHSLASVDLCLRLHHLGWRTVYVGGSEWIDSTALPRPDCPGQPELPTPAETRALQQLHDHPTDPYYNPNLSDAVSFCPGSGALLAERQATTGPLRVLVAAHNLNNPEGAPRYLAEIVLGLLERDAIAPVVWSPTGGRGEAVYQGAGVPVCVEPLPYASRFVDFQWSPREYARFQAEAARLLERHRPDVVLVNTLCCFPLVEAAAWAGVPSVWIIHESFTPTHLERLLNPFSRGRCELALRLADWVVPASHDTARCFAHLAGRHNVQVIHNGLPTEAIDRTIKCFSRADARAELGLPPQTRHFICVGTICERKGQHTLVEAAAILARSRRDFRCDLIGLRDGIPYASYVQHLVQHHELTDLVRLVPETDAIHTYFRAADGFVCTSHLEAFSRAILEAEAFGLPIVSTDCPGVAEQVNWGQNALYFPPNDAPRLAQHLQSLLDDPARRQAMSQASRALFESHLSYEQMLTRYERVLRCAYRQRADRQRTDRQRTDRPDGQQATLPHPATLSQPAVWSEPSKEAA